MDHLEPAHLVCVLITLERFLIETHVHLTLALRAGDYTPSGDLDTLRKLWVILRGSICAQTRTMPEDAMPPLLPLVNLLPAHMQMQLEQAIEAERWGQATHQQCCVSLEAVRDELERHATAALRATLRPPPQPAD